MHKQITTVITAVATVCLLSSCTATGVFGQAGQRHETSPTDESRASSASNAGSDTAEVPAFHFASGDLVLEAVDRATVKNNMFNPCEEISVEEFAAVGYSSDRKTRRDAVRNLNVCRLDSIEDPSEYAALIAGPGNREEFRNTGLLLDENPSQRIPQMYVTRPIKAEENICYATVDTARGQFSVAIDDLFGDTPRQELCSQAVQILESFYNINK